MYVIETLSLLFLCLFLFDLLFSFSVVFDWFILLSVVVVVVFLLFVVILLLLLLFLPMSACAQERRVRNTVRVTERLGRTRTG